VNSPKEKARDTIGAPMREPGAERPHLPTVLAGLMLGMFVAALNWTVVAPAMPRIVSELGGMAQYSWIAVSTLLASTIVIPLAGKFSDLYGRKQFYVGGIVVFMASSLLAGLANSFEIFMLARILEGFGIGTMMPLAQTILADIVTPRERGKYQGLIGGVFGVASVIGPLYGGYITEQFSWRWLFFLNVPLGLLALAFIVPYMKLPFVRRSHDIDFPGIIAISSALTFLLLALAWGGTRFPWNSPIILTFLCAGAAAAVAVVYVEGRAAEPVMPLELFRNPVFAWANLANMAVAVLMFGVIYYIPVFVQGVQGVSVAASGAVLTPMMVSIVLISALTGYIATRTGRYKVPLLAGISVVCVGVVLLALMDRSTTYAEVVRNMMVIGLGLGTTMQTYVLAVQNAADDRHLGAATASMQLFRSIGASLGVVILGTLMTSRMASALAAAGVADRFGPRAAEDAGALLDPQLTADLPIALLEPLRSALQVSLATVFVGMLPFALLALLATSLLPEIPLRSSRSKRQV
jgi:EmrB/QacA subfamily drug resistance transporter